MIWRSWSILCLLLLASWSSASTESLMLVPMPREITESGGEATIAKDWTVCVTTTDPADQVSAKQIAEEARTSGSATLKIEHTAKDHNVIVIAASAPDPGATRLFNEQGYTLGIEANRVTIEAPTATGRFYGAQTLRQLLRTSPDGNIPCLKIRDWPAMEWRGVSDDVSRGQVSTVEDFKNIVRQLAYYKKNLYEPYIEDMFRFDADPNIGAERGAITKAEMAEILAESNRCHVTLTPVFETLGHQDRLLGLPENRKYAEVQDPKETPWSFAPVNTAAVKFIIKLVDELAAATPSPFFHIGGDESWDVGAGVSKARVKAVGAGRVHADFFTQLHDHIADKLKRRTILYSDMLLHHPDSLKTMPKDMMISDWHYDPDGKFESVKKLKDAGYMNVLTSPGIWSWDTFYPNYDWGFRNSAGFTKVGKREGAIGSVVSSWGDNGAENLRENNLTGYAYSAAIEWEPETATADEFLPRFVATRYGVDSPALVQAEKLLGWGVPAGFSGYGQLFHRSLRLKPGLADQLTTMAQLERDMETAHKAIADARRQVRFDAKHLDVLDHVARRISYMAKRQLALSKIARLLGDKPSGDLPADKQAEIRANLDKLRDSLSVIAAEYPKLWLRRNKFPKLDFNITRLYGQVGQLQDFITRAQTGSLRAEQPPDGTWFWYPDPDPKTKATTGSRFMIRTLDLPSDIDSAELRVFADDGCRVSINGKRAARATYGGGAVVKDVRDMLRKGHNYLAVDASNNIGAAGVMLTLSIVTPDGQQIITGDDKWRVTKTEHPGWKTAEPQGKDWVPVKLLGKGLTPPWTQIDW